MSKSYFWTYQKLEKATGEKWAHPPSHDIINTPLCGISFDSRSITKNSVFIAIQGLEKDGHNYIAAAIKNGASAIIASDISFLQTMKAPTLQVQNTQSALETLGIYARQNISAKRVAITGSVGKTSTKDLLYHMLENQAPTWANIRSFNNLWGVPITLANMPSNTKYGIFEIGTNHEGEIEPLTKQVHPHIALITSVGSAHQGNFPSFKHLLTEKSAISKGLTPGGKVILPKDHPQFHQLEKLAKENGATKIYTFGYHEESNLRILKATPCSTGLIVKFFLEQKILEKKVPLYGKHWANNIAAALCAGHLLHADTQKMLDTLETFIEPKGRGQLLSLLLPSSKDKKFFFMDQTYNANPQSVSMALETLQNAPIDNVHRRIAILGDMYEIGNEEESYASHACLSDSIDIGKTHMLITIGLFSKALHDKMKNTPIKTLHFDTNREAICFLQSYVEENDLLMAKATNKLNFQEIIQAFV